MSNITEQQFSDFVEFLTQNIEDYTEKGDAVRLDYSGRYMNGKTCVGFVTDSPIKQLVELALVTNEQANNYVNEREGDDFVRLVSRALRNAKTDNMGKNTIVYFPTISNKKVI